MNNVKIIAECAQGFEGSLKLAKELVFLAKQAGSDLVKFQMIIADELCTSDYVHFDLFKSLELQHHEYLELVKLSQELEIELCFDVFGYESLRVCEDLNLKTIKIHPTDLNNVALLQALNKTEIEEVILGVGGALIEEIDLALSYLTEKKITLLLGHQAYPTPLEDNGLFRLNYLNQKYSGNSRINFGFADHEPPESEYSRILPAMAVSLGAKYIEKHFTTNSLLKLEDSETALNADEFNSFTKMISRVETILGDQNSGFILSESEIGYRKNIRRHVVASRDLAAGHLINYDDLKLLRTSEVAPMHNLELCVGRKLKSKVKLNEALTNSMLE